MGRKQKTSAIERIAELTAVASLAAASAFAVAHLAPLSGAMLWAAAVAGAGAAALVALGAVRRFDPPSAEMAGFVPVDLTTIAVDELLLDQPLAMPEAGEMVTRIADYLEAGRELRAEQSSANADEAARREASAALHAALADIRRSLR